VAANIVLVRRFSARPSDDAIRSLPRAAFTIPLTVIRPYCDIGRSSSGRPLPDLTADLSTSSVLAKESGRP